MRMTGVVGWALAGLSLLVLVAARSGGDESASPRDVLRLSSPAISAPSPGRRARDVRRGSWTSSARPVTLELLDDGLGTMRVAAGNAAPITVRRANATGSRPVMEDDTLVVRDASPGVDAVLFAHDTGIEELLVVKEPGAELRYDLDLPRGFRLRQTKAFPRSVEVLRPGGTPLLRFVADQAWDAGGRDVPLRVAIEGRRIEVSIPPDAALPVVVDPAWTNPSFTNVLRFFHTATALSNGKVLLAGGDDNGTAELFDPLAGTFEQVAEPLIENRSEHAATLLRDGKVLLAGGRDDTDAPIGTTEVYDPVANNLTSGPSMSVAHVAPTVTLLDGGDVLVAGGIDGSSAERYHHASKAFESAIPMGFATVYHTATRLADGTVLFRSGNNAQIYSPQIGSFLPPTTLTTDRFAHTATLLPGGEVFFGAGIMNGVAITSEVYDPDSGTLSQVPLAVPRQFHAASLLPTGDVLLSACLVAKFNGYCDQAAELFSPATGQATSIDPIPYPQNGPTSTVLPDGSAFVLGSSVVPGIYRPAPKWIHEEQEIEHDITVAVPLPSGKVLLAGEEGAYLYDPSSSSLSALIPGSESLHPHAGVGLMDGRALLTSEYLNDIRIYDPASGPLGSISWAAQLVPPREAATVTSLPDGTVLIAGGRGAGAESIAADVYRPSTGELEPVGDMIVSRSDHTATRLPDGRVLLAGGLSPQARGTAELYDPVSRTFEPVEHKMKTGMVAHSATLLPNGQVLLVGDGVAQIFDPDFGYFQYSGAPFHVYEHRSAITPPGRVLLFGVFAVQLYDPLTDEAETLEDLSAMPHRRTALLLPSGDVLTTFLWKPAGTYPPGLSIWHDAMVPGGTPRPVLSSAPGKAVSGDTVDIAGVGLTGFSEGSDGSFKSSPANFPVPVWIPWPEGTPSWGTATEWSASGAKWTVPPTSYPGLGLLFVVVNGIPSNGLPVVVEPGAPGAPCAHGPGCASGICVDGVCCEHACTGCESCAHAMTGMTDGVCGPRIDPTTAEGACCDGESTLELPGGDSEDCGEYRCPAGSSRCSTKCATNADCRAGKVCSTDHECEDPISVDIVRGCTACSTGGTARGGQAIIAFALAFFLQRCRRRGVRVQFTR